MASEFQSWFEAQHGPRHRSGMSHCSDQALRDMMQAGRTAEQVLACRELWDEKQQSALYAWQAREKTPSDSLTGCQTAPQEVKDAD